MLPETNRSCMGAVARILLTFSILLLPLSAMAGELDIKLVESDHAVTVQVRGIDAQDTTVKRVITSRKGALLFVDGQTAKIARLRAKGKHRLAYVQIGRNGDRVAIRLAQNSRRKGHLRDYIVQEAVEGGIDITVSDQLPGTLESDPKHPEPVAEAPARPEARQDLAALEKALAAPLDDEPLQEPAEPQTQAQPAEDSFQEPDPATEPDDGSLEGVQDDSPDAVFGSTSDKDSAGRSWLGAMFFPIFLMAGGLAWWWNKRRTPVVVGQDLRILSRVGIGPRQQVVWLKAGDREFLVGATERGIALLSELGAQAVANAAPAKVAEDTEPAAPTASKQRVAAFKARLRQALGGEIAGTTPEAEDTEIPPHLQLLTSDPRWARNEQAA